MNLTAKTVAALTLPADKTDVIHFNSDLPGFGYRLRRGADGKARATWVAQYRNAGRTWRVLIGPAAAVSAADARAKAKKVLGAVALGEDPQGAKHDRRGRDAYTLTSVVADYPAAKQSKVRQKTLVETTRYLAGGYFRPLHAVALDTVSRKDVAASLVRIQRESGNVSAARAKAALSALYAWAMRMGLADSNPCIGAGDVSNSKPRERVRPISSLPPCGTSAVTTTMVELYGCSF